MSGFALETRARTARRYGKGRILLSSKRVTYPNEHEGNLSFIERVIDRVCMKAENGEKAKSGRPRIHRGWWMTFAAVVLIAVVALLVLRGTRADGIAQLAALAPRSQRLIEPRLSGGFAWARYRGPERTSVSTADADHLQLAGQAGEAMARAKRDDSAAAQHTAGVAMMLIDRPDDAIQSLELAVQRAPKDASAWSDLAAARYVAAIRYLRPSLYSEALASADEALRFAPDHPEALFNRALILDRLGLREEARAAWKRYLAADGSSAWAAEAQRYLKENPAVDLDLQFRRELPQLESAAISGNAARVRALVALYPQQARSFSEGEHLGRWGEAEQRGDSAEAARMLAIARVTGDALRARGETLLGDAVAAIDASTGPRRAALAEAHVLYRRGRMLYAQQKPTEAGAALRDAASRFERGGSPMALVARYFAANTAFDRQQTKEARAQLEALLRESDAHRGYVSLGAQVRWELALCAIIDASWPEARDLLLDAEANFTRMGETRNAAAISGFLATALMGMGRFDDAWAARIRSLEALSAAGNAERLMVAIGAATRMELRVRRLAPARALVQLEEAVGRRIENPVLLADALMRDALINEQLGDNGMATQSIHEASIAAAAIGDPAFRSRAQADVQFGNGAVLLATEPLRAREDLSRAIDAYVASGYALSMPEAYLLRARAAVRLGDRESARRDIDRGIETLERHSISFAGSVVGTGVLDAGRTLYEDAIRLCFAAHDDSSAFAYAERLRAQLATMAAPIPSPEEVRQRLAGSGAAVLELIALPDEVAAFCITERGGYVARSPIARTRLSELVARDDVAALYDVLIRPSLAAIGGARTLIVVADAPLRNVPFGALGDGKHRLIEQLAVVTAPSAAVLQRDTPSLKPRSLLAIVLPSGDVTAMLPDSEREIADLRAVYAEATVLTAGQATFRSFASAARRANVLHISGHTDREPAEQERAFVFANGERVSWQTVAATPIARDSVVVLAACETLRAPLASTDRSLSLGEAFLSAGARGVLGTLTPIADRDARDLFTAFHRQLASGYRPEEALRRVQREAAARGTDDAWRSVVFLTNHIPAPG